MSKKGYVMTEEHKNKISAAKKGKPVPWVKLRSFKKGNIPWNKGLSIKLNDGLKKWRDSGGQSWNKGLIRENNPNTGRKLTEEVRKKMSEIAKKRVLEGKCNLWKGGVREKNYSERKSIMDSFEYKQWRRLVFERDKFTCQVCGQIGGKLQADHIKPFATFPELRLELLNGRTLCIPCHKNTDTYGSVKKSQNKKNKTIN